MTRSSPALAPRKPRDPAGPCLGPTGGAVASTGVPVFTDDPCEHARQGHARDRHLQRKQVMSNFEMEDWRAQTVVSLVERAGPTKVFTIGSADRKHADGWTPPALFHLRGTPLGALDVTEFFGGFGRFTVRDGKIVPVPKVQWRTLRAEEQFDALLYLGPPPVATSPEPFSTALCAEPGYVDMRLRRLALAHLPPSETERLKKLCGA